MNSLNDDTVYSVLGIGLDGGGQTVPAQPFDQGRGVVAHREGGYLQGSQPALFLIVHDFEAHGRDAGAGKPDYIGGRSRQIDYSVVDKGSAIVDPDDHALIGRKAPDADDRPKREGAMRRGEFVGVKGLAVRSQATLKLSAVPGGDPFQLVSGLVGDDRLDNV